jgi:hypothetical protein
LAQCMSPLMADSVEEVRHEVECGMVGELDTIVRGRNRLSGRL